ncbi:helix-turn-helix domain-containing protein, partial [Parabacteroides sp. W1-Q-101]
GYVQQGLTIKELSEILHTNRTYLSAYIKTTYKMTFREWITDLRLEYAKNILKEHPEINIQKLAESSGFLSRSNFIKSFTEKEGCTPGKWKKANLE